MKNITFTRFFLFCTCNNCQGNYVEIYILDNQKRRDLSNKYYSFCAVLSNMVNRFYYLTPEFNKVDAPWIFLLRDNCITDEERKKYLINCEKSFSLESYDELNSIIKIQSRYYKRSIQLKYSYKLQKEKTCAIITMNRLRCFVNPLFNHMSLLATNRTMKQREEKIKIALLEEIRDKKDPKSVHNIYKTLVEMIGINF